MKRILWFRRDLRVNDNPLLFFNGEVLPIFIFDSSILYQLEKNDRRVTFIFHYVTKLKEELLALGLNLKVFYGKPQDVFEHLLREYEFDEVVASGDNDTYAKERDLHISHKIHFRYLQDTYIFRHNEVLKDNGEPYFVFTHFYKKARIVLQSKNIEEIFKGDSVLIAGDFEGISKVDSKVEVTKLPFDIQSIGFVKNNLQILSPYEKLDIFKAKIDNYKEQRDFLDIDANSNLSVDLRFGTIGVREILRFVFSLKDSDIEPFIRQLIFRDFYAYLLFHIPRIESENYKYAFNGIQDHEKYEKFITAKTGVPIIDAGVRELLQTGNMHNRVRMIVASFFTKDLLLPWQWGERFFAKHLLDFDKASNVLSWQWSAGTGVDPQPYFRVFNPYLQSKKFDKDAKYIKRFCPELKWEQAKNLHNEEYLLKADIPNYQKPMLRHKEAAAKAIEVFKTP